jgi:hypothetical protein
MPCWRELERVASPLLRQLHDYWQSKRAGRDIPDRRDIDPLEMKELLPNILISEPAFYPFRIRYRLVGTRVVRVSGIDFTGRYLDELLRPEIQEDWHGHYQISLYERIPVYGSITSPTTDGGTFTYEFGIFPLTKGGTEVAQFLALEDFGKQEPFSRQFYNNVKYFE